MRVHVAERPGGVGASPITLYIIPRALLARQQGFGPCECRFDSCRGSMKNNEVFPEGSDEAEKIYAIARMAANHELEDSKPRLKKILENLNQRIKDLEDVLKLRQ